MIAAALAVAGIVRIGVFGLFHPGELVVRPAPDQALVVEAGAERVVLEGRQMLRAKAAGEGMELLSGDRRWTASSLVASPRARAGEFVLGVPGKIRRSYRGTLSITAAGGALVAVVSMNVETAVASAVEAESPPGAPLQALMAQAVVTRSYYAAAGPRHAGFDFCDTTHCQFLRAPPTPGSLAAIAAARTRDIVLSYHGRTIAALFSASCGGRTRALAEPGPDGYPYFELNCEWCRRTPRQGHGLGLCQMGAKAMASHGASFREILRHYFPNAEIRDMQVVPDQ